MKRNSLLALVLAAVLALPGCGAWASEAETRILLSDAAVTVDGHIASTDPDAQVYVGADIVYYRDGTDESYGEGTAEEMHSDTEAAAHTVVTITQPGTYRIQGTLSQGQIAVDLGKEAVDDPKAVVTLILDGVDVTCTVAPALIFYNVYECDRSFADHGGEEGFEGTAAVDTAQAGANVVLAEGTVNTFTGSHVARIYKEGTTKKLHKYDGAFYSKMSMNIGGEGQLHIVGDNEGLNSELHLTINGGVISIESQDDGINTNEDYVSVTTINAGHITIDAGLGGEGDGIDSNGFLVINGGWLYSTAHPGADGGIDAEMPIQLNGGTVFAFGGRNDEAAGDSKQPYMQLSFATRLPAGSVVSLQDEAGRELWGCTTVRECQSVTLTDPALQLDTVYRLYVDGVLQSWSGNRFGFGGGRPDGLQRPDAVSGATPPQPPQEGQQPPRRPEDHGPGHDFDRGHRGDFDPADRPEGFDPGAFHGGFWGEREESGESSVDFVLTETNRSFSGVQEDLPFDDVSPQDAGYAAIRKLCKAGAMEGTGEGKFSPDMTLTRAQAVTVLARLAGAEQVETGAFSDVAAGSWYAGYVGWAVEKGIVQGDGEGHFFPDMTVTGEQLALMLGRYQEGYQSAHSFEGALNRAQLAQMAAEVL